MDQSKQGHGKGKEGKRKGDDEVAGSSNGSNGHEEFPAELAAQAQAAGEAEKLSVEKGIDAWKKVVAAAPASWAPKRELARVYKKAERWNAFIEVMKDAVDKANWAQPEDKIPLLFEMIEVYRDRLKLDVMVVNAFNQILNIQPTNEQAGEALAAQYETMKRWPDLISLLRRKAGAVSQTPEKVALQLRVANLFLEKFSNQAEAIKAYEAILELDPNNEEALGFLKQMYEKRRDWEKLVGVHQREIELLADEESKKLRRVEVAKLASEKLKKPAISIDLWKQVTAGDPENVEALGELEKLYEREKAWAELGDVLQKQVAVAGDAAKRSALLVKLGILYTEKVQDGGKATLAWQALLQQEPDNRRAQDALKKLYLQNKDWDALEKFYAAQNKWDELVRVLERQAETEDGVSLWNKIGELYREKLNKADRAQKAFEKALSIDAQNLVAAEALIPLYEKGKDVRRLADVLMVQLNHTSDRAERHARIQRLSELLEGDAGDKGNALWITLQGFSEQPTNEWAQTTSRRLAGESGNWAQLVEAYEAALPKVGDETDALPILGTLARAYEKELANPEAAIARNQRILKTAPKDPEAVDALERLYVATGRFADLLAIYDKKLELAKSKAETLEIRMKLASLYEDEAKQPEKAIELYDAILKEDPRQVKALAALDRIYQSLGKWTELALVMEQEIALASSTSQGGGAVVELKFRRGAVLDQHLGDAAGAVTSYREALAQDPTHVGARTSLQAFLSNGDAGLQMAAVETLEPIYEQTEELPRLVEVQRIRLGREKNTGKRVALLLRIGQLEGKLGNGEQAWDAYAKAFGESPDSVPAREALENLATIMDTWPPLVGLYEKALSASKGKEKLPASLERELMLVVAVAYDEKLGQSEKAVEYFRRAQQIQPEDASALVALERLYTRTERWSDLVDTLTKKATLVTDAGERELIRTRIATVWEEMLGNVEQAIVAWNVVLKDSARNLQALRALDRLYQQKGDFRDLADNLGQQLALAQENGDPADTIALLGRLGVLREQRLGQMGGAVETYRKILQQEPEHAETLAALERILPDPKAREHELEVAQLLEPVYKIRGDWPRLIGVFEIEARHAVDPEAKITLLRLIADGYEVGLDDPARAYDALGRALKEDPLNAEVQATIERLARALGQLPDLVGRFQGLVGQVADPELKNALLHKVALLCEIELGDDAQAAAAYAAALDASPRDLRAANALEQLYLRGSDYPNLVLLLMRKAEIVEGLAEKKTLYYKAAQIYEEVIEDLEQSIVVFKQVLSVDDGDRVSLDQLERLYIRLARWSELKNIYSKKAELAPNPAEKKQMLFVLGQVYDRELNDPERAIETYSSIMDLDPDDFDAAQALDRLYVHTQRWYDLLAVLERQTELAPSPAEVVSLKFRVGELWREHLKDLTRAIEAYRGVLQMDPSHEPTLRALEALMSGRDEPVLAASVLEPIYESAGEWDRVIAVYEVMQANADDVVRRVELLSRIAELEERRLSHQSKAFEAYGRALHVDPSNADVLQHLQRLAADTGHWAKLAALFSAELARLEDTRQKVDMMLRLARVYEEETGQVDEAIATYGAVLGPDGEPDNKEALVALDRLYSHAQRWEELAEVIRREVRIAPTDDAIVALNFRLAQVFELAILDLPKAVAAYKEILQADPAHAETRAALERMFMGGTLQLEIAEVLEPLYRSGAEWEKLAQINEVQLSRITDVAERQSLLRRLAEIAEQKLVDQVAAFGWWAQAVKEDPASEQALDELVRLARATHQWDAYVQTMSATASPEGEPRSPAVRRDVLLRLAATFETELGDLERAENALVQVLGENEKDPAALASLDRIYEAQGMYENLAAALRQRIAITDDTTELGTLQLRLGRVYAEALDDQPQAIASYLVVLEHESRSVEALEALERLYFRGEQWPELYGIYEKLVDTTNDEQTMADCYARMAKLATDALGQREKAVELWGRVLDVRSDDPAALGGLADLHELASEWKELTEVLEKQVAATGDPDAKIPIYKRLGRIWGEKLSRERNSLESWMKVLELDPQDVDALRAIAANYRSAGAWEELSQALRRLIQVGQLGESGIAQDELKELFAQLGELEGETLMRTQDSIDAWREVLEIDQGDFRALAALEKLFMQEARWEEAVDILERRARALATPTEQIDVLMQAASLWADKIGDGGSAAEVYERVLQLDPGHQTASIELEGLYKQRKSWVKLVDLLLSRTQYTADAPGRIALLVQTAGIYEQQLNDLDSAFVTLRAAFQEDYSNDHVAKELERLATAADKWNELIGEYTQLVQGIADPKTAADLWVKIARWYDSALRHIDYAVASAQQALQLDNAHVGALQTLEDFYRKQKKWGDLVGALARHAEVEQEPTARVDILLQLADTYETQIGDTAQATFAYQRALDTDERCIDAISALERLYRRTQAWDRLVEVLSKKAQVVDDTEQGIKLRLQVGELWESRLGDNDRAIEAYKEVLSVDPQNLAALKALDVLFEKTGRMEEYLENLEHQLEVSPEGDRAGIYQEMATTWEEKFGKPERAAEVLEKVLLIEDRNQKAYRDLERLYRQERKWESLVDTYRKHILVANDGTERIDLYTKMGVVYETELRDLDRAIDAFSDVLNVEAEHSDALAGLARLYEETEQWERAIDVMRRLVAITNDPKQKVDLNYRLGKIFDEQMKDPEPATEYLVEALSQDPAHVPSMLSLLGIYKRRGDWMKAAQLMVRAEAATVNTLEKTRLIFEAAKIFQEKLSDDAQATELYARVLQLDPEHVDAGEPLSELYFRREEWGPLVPILEMLARKADRKTNRELTLLYHRLAKAADRLGDGEKALKYYKQSYDLDSTYLPTLIDRAALLYKLEHWDDAFRIYQTILVHHRDAQKDDDIVDIFFRLGRIKLKLGERTKAVNMLEKALEIQPGHRATLQALIDLYADAGDFEAVIKQKRGLLASQATDTEEKFKLAEEIAGIYKDKLNNPQKAIAANMEALTFKPTDHQILHNLLDLFSETKQWKKAMEILGKLADLESGKVKARYLVAAGNIANYELHSTDEAVDLYNTALDNDPDDLKAFERIDKVMTAKKDWKNQERNFRKMIKRFGQEPTPERKPTVVALWHGLGEIYRSRLKDYKSATAAFEVAVQLDPDGIARHQILAELYQLSGPDSYDKAVQAYRHLVKVSPDFGQMATHMKTLRRLYMETRQYDRAWCVTSAMAFLRKADPEEQQFFEQYRPKGFARARARLTEELWQRNIYHPDEDRYISHVFAAVSQVVAAVRAKEHKDWGLKRKDKRDVATDQLLFSKVFNYVNQVLGVPQPELYLRPESPGELDLANAREKAALTPSFVVGANLLQGRPEKELAYVIGKKLTFMRPDHFVRWPNVVPTVAELKVVFLAALRLVQPNLPVKPDLAQPVGQYYDALRKLMPPQMSEQLGVVVQRFLATKGEADLHKWSNAVDLTATRAGLLVCNDLDVAARLAQAEPVSVGVVEPKEKIKDLIQWSISDEYFTLREHLGLIIGQG